MEIINEIGCTTLDKLVEKGTIKSYRYINVSADGIECKKSKFRNTERLVLEFLNGEEITIDSLCSGSDENTSMWISDDGENISNTVLLRK